MDSNNACHEDWTWESGLYCHEESNYDEAVSLWKEVSMDNVNQSCMIDGISTPIKACGITYHPGSVDTFSKLSEERREVSQFKRRRMLHFDSEVVESHQCSEDLFAFTKANECEASLDEIFPATNQSCLDFPDVSTSSYDCLDQQSEQWFADCLNDCEMTLSPDSLNLTDAADIQIDISEFCHDEPESDATPVKKAVAKTPRNVIFKGRKSFIRTPSKLPSSVAYPFAFIKPCGFQGHITLNDINQRIQTPPPKPSKNQNDPLTYPTSAFSGKPVVGKTKIRTEGGKGSITIMRTKG